MTDSKRSPVASEDLPRYSVSEAARYLRIPETTLRAWVVGRRYDVSSGSKRSETLIRRPDPKDPRLSFSNLVEAHVLAALRRVHRVRMRDVREALSFTREKLGIERVLLSKDLRAVDRNVFLSRLGTLLNVGRGGQEAIAEVLQAYLERIEWGSRNSPIRVFPVTRENFRGAPRVVTIDPRIAFGRPVVERRSISTAVIAERFRAGEAMTAIADDYDLEASEVEEALRYEALPFAA